jgi:hypothetical protein
VEGKTLPQLNDKAKELIVRVGNIASNLVTLGTGFGTMGVLAGVGIHGVIEKMQGHVEATYDPQNLLMITALISVVGTGLGLSLQNKVDNLAKKWGIQSY